MAIDAEDLSKNVLHIGAVTSTGRSASYDANMLVYNEPVMQKGSLIPVSMNKRVVAEIRDIFICEGSINKGDQIEFIVEFEDSSKKSYIGEVLQIHDKTVKINVTGKQDINLIIKKIGGFKNGIKS